VADITVRKMPFEWPDDLPILASTDDVSGSCELVGFSLTMPHLEPYLIRTMRVGGQQATDPTIAEDMKNFSAQEAQHHRNHSLVNKIVRDKLSPETAAQVEEIEAELEADYREFTKDKSLQFNLAYAEGFEAMTLSMALARFDNPREGMDAEWGRLMAWHLAEEVEHRTVAFDAYDHLFGSYFYRLRVGVWAQKHFMSYVLRLARCVQQDFTESGDGKMNGGGWELFKKQWTSGFLPRYLKTLPPWYNPAKIEIPQGIRDMWAAYDELAVSADEA
jgi:predicted metal-dependent hydrolase